jgi:aminopeptidase N
MTVRTLDADGVRLRRFVKPGTPARDIRAALRTARDSLRAYERRFGPYGARELDIVEGPAEVANGGVAMEYPELVLSPPWPPALAHEIAHQWWFGIVGNDEWTEPWLDEAMAEYATASLPQRIAGPDRLGLCPTLPARRPALTSTMARFDKADPRLYSRSIYVAGACALTRLERGLGRQRMDRFLRGLVSDHRFGVLTTAGFVRALRRAAPEGFDVNRWLKRSRIDVR